MNYVDIFFWLSTPSQRILKEHFNDIIEKDGLPKEMDFNQVSQDFITSVVWIRNHISRKSLNYHVPLEVFLSYVS